MSIEIKPIHPFGAEVGVDLSDRRNDVVLVDLLQKHGLLVMRNQVLTLDEQLSLMGLFGPVVDDRTQAGYVSNVQAEGLFGDVALSFHQDYVQTAVPLLALSLHAVDVEDDVAPTAFASGERALAVMPPDLRAELHHHQVFNVWPLSDQVRNGRGDEDVTIEWPGAVHDVFAVDPLTGRHIVTASRMMTAKIMGVGKQRSDGLLGGLYKVLYAEDNLYQHHWIQGDLVIWSNLAASHARGWLTSSRRTLQRVCTGHGTPADYKPHARTRQPVRLRLTTGFLSIGFGRI